MMARTLTAAIPTRCAIQKDPQEDVKRRDFTINGLLMDPLDGDAFWIMSADATICRRASCVRSATRERRFAEDKLRMLRAVRFAARFGYCDRGEDVCGDSRSWRQQIHQVSRERVRDELTKMLTEGHARGAFELLDATGLLHRCCRKSIA